MSPNRGSQLLQTLSLQNSAVDLSLDQILENAFDDHCRADRGDWLEIRRTVEAFLLATLTLDSDSSDLNEVDSRR